MSVSDSATTQQDQSTGQAPFPLNRVVAFLGPFLAIFSGAVATWLIEKLPGLNIDKATLASDITAAVVFLVAAGGSFAMHHKWLSGWQQWEQSVTDVTKVAEPGLMPAGPYDPTEFAAPLPGAGDSPPGADDLPPGADDSLGAAGDSQSAAGDSPSAAGDPLAQSAANLGSGPQAVNGELPPPLVDPGFVPDADQTHVLPDAQQELTSVPGADGDASASSRPETAAKPDTPTDETEPAVV